MIADCSKGVTSDEKKAGVGNQESEVRRTREQGTGNREQGTGSSPGFLIADSPRHPSSTGSLPRSIGVPPVKIHGRDGRATTSRTVPDINKRCPRQP
jgi:hypothetical protein